jgi:hypothetical protein
MQNKISHPWAEFLFYRYKAILWMEKEMNYSDEEIAFHLSMDERQVFLIKTGKRNCINEEE